MTTTDQKTILDCRAKTGQIAPESHRLPPKNKQCPYNLLGLVTTTDQETKLDCPTKTGQMAPVSHRLPPKKTMSLQPTGSRDHDRPGDETGLPETGKAGQIAAVNPRLALGQVGNQGLDHASPGVRLVNAARHEGSRRGARPLAKVGDGQRSGAGQAVQDHGQEVPVGRQRGPRALHRLNVRPALERAGGQA